MVPGPEDVDHRVAAIARSLSREAPTFADDVFARLSSQAQALYRDDTVRGLIEASIQENVTTVCDLIAEGIDVETMWRLRRRPSTPAGWRSGGVPVEALLHAYRIGHHVFLQWWFTEFARRDLDPAQVLAAVEVVTRPSFGYVDRICAQLVEVYVGERDRWLENASGNRLSVVRRLLSGDDTTGDQAEASLCYRLRRGHVGLVLWLVPGHRHHQGVGGLDTVSAALRASSSRETLTVMADESTPYVWLAADELP